MKKFSIIASAFVLAAAVAISSGAARAQEGPVAAAESAIESPIVHVVHAVLPKKTPAGDYWLKASVIHFDSREIVVSEVNNERMIHTFTYASTLQSKMDTVEGKGGYQYGDQVRILYQPGQTVALEIHGKPSKPQ